MIQAACPSDTGWDMRRVIRRSMEGARGRTALNVRSALGRLGCTDPKM
jgi:hypothetical protein